MCTYWVLAEILFSLLLAQLVDGPAESGLRTFVIPHFTPVYCFSLAYLCVLCVERVSGLNFSVARKQV